MKFYIFGMAMAIGLVSAASSSMPHSSVSQSITVDVSGSGLSPSETSLDGTMGSETSDVATEQTNPGRKGEKSSTSSSRSSTITITIPRTSTVSVIPSAGTYSTSIRAVGTAASPVSSGSSSSAREPQPKPYITKSWPGIPSVNTQWTSATIATLDPLPNKQPSVGSSSSSEDVASTTKEPVQAGKPDRPFTAGDSSTSTDATAPVDTHNPRKPKRPYKPERPDKPKKPHMVTSLDELEEELERLGRKAVILFAPIIKDAGAIQFNVDASGDGGTNGWSPKGPVECPAQHTVTKTVTDCDCSATTVAQKPHDGEEHGSHRPKSSGQSSFYTTTRTMVSTMTFDSSTTITTTEINRSPAPNVVITAGGTIQASITAYVPLPVISTSASDEWGGSKSEAYKHDGSATGTANGRNPSKPRLPSM